MYVSSATRVRGRRRLLAALVVLCVVVGMLAVAAGALALSERGALPSNTVIGGVDVGGMTNAEARRVLDRAARQQRRRPIALTVTKPGEDVTVTVTGALLGAQPRIGDAIEAADGIGLPTRLVRRLGLGGEDSTPLLYSFDATRLDRLQSELDGRVATEPTDATLSVTGSGTTIHPGVPGRTIDLAGLVRRLQPLPRVVSVPISVVAPAVSTAAAERARAQVDALLTSARTISIGSRSVTLQPSFLRHALVIEPEDGELVVSLDEGRLRQRLRSTFRDRLRAPRNASFRVEGRHVVVIPSAPGRDLDVTSISRSLLAHPASTVHRARFKSLAPSLTTEEARAMGIREQVSGFTTYYPCCAARVTNIQRGAQILDGTVVPPGGTFSLNEALGRRTEERGFVFAPQILAGRLEDAVGGGVSQIATTMYNAAFFAGMRLDAHQAHQFYISRYPMGREATVSWGGPEMIFTNDWKAGLLIKVSAWSTGINIRFYSSKLGRRVETETEEPYSYVQPTTRIVKNPALKPGERNVVQEAGPAGFTVEYTRKVYRGDKLIRDERFRTRYDAENAYVEVGPPKKKPKPKEPVKPPSDGTGDTTTPTETTPTTTTGGG